MNNTILEFLDVYKKLDELCKQIFGSDIGVSKYIDEMEKDIQGSIYITGWEKDYKQLKHMRWVRNQLVHDTNSFERNIVTLDDIEWLKRFQSRIISCSDPFSLLNQYKIQSNGKPKMSDEFAKKNKTRNKSVFPIVALVLGIILLITIISISIFSSIFKYAQNSSFGKIDNNTTDNFQNSDVDFQTLTYSGEGATAIKNINVPSGNYYIIGKYYGNSNFVAELNESSNDNFGHLIANKVGACETIYGIKGPLNNGYINIKMASGKWEFSIVACQKISEDELNNNQIYTGSGAKVISDINLPKGEYYITCTYKGEGNFAVSFYNSVSDNFGDLIANEIGTSEVVCGINGPVRQGYIDIKMADGAWTITIEPCQ